MAPEHETPGRRTLANVVDSLAKVSPARAVCKMPNSPQAVDGFSTLTMEELSKAVDSTALLIERSLGKACKDAVLLYLGESDIRYLVVVVVCQKTGYRPFLPSLKNTIDVQAALLEQTGCSGILFSTSHKDLAQSVGKASGIDTTALIEVPSIEKMVANFSSRFPYDTAYQAIEDQSAIIIHSSGTTGIPKPIPMTHGFLGTIDRQTEVPIPDGRESAIPNRLGSDDLFLSTAPFFHIMGIFAQLMSVFNGTPFVYPSPTATPLTVDSLTLSTLRMVCIGGAPLAPEIGTALNERTNLVSVMGASELGLVLSLIPENKEDWEYFEWNPHYGVHMDPCRDGDEENKDNLLYELVIPRRETRDIHGIFHTFPHLTPSYRTKDLFSRHPTRPNLWKYEGRVDDTMILTNGTKINPVPMEKIIESHPLVSRAVVIGHRRTRTAVLVEPAEGSDTSELIQDSTSAAGRDSSVSTFARAIWPSVEQANTLVPDGAGIGIMRIGLASAQKPFRTTPKGSTQRRRVLEDYEEEIDRVYARDEYWYNMLRHG
ncbi:hypothetical protein BDV11DRAFT_210135 [Aspergillus similis]